MSRLEELIQTLCPDGVEHRELAELADIGTGNSNRVDAIDDGKYPFFVRSKQVMRSNKYDFDEEAIVIPGEGGIGEIFHYIRGKYDLHQRAYRISFRDSRVNTRFAYYYMRSNFKKFITMKAVTATVISIRMPMIASFLLPIPPLPIQEEIVRILDTFTALEAELENQLEAELAARTKQYEHYRNKLLSFNNVEFQLLTVAEVCETITDYVAAGSFADLRKKVVYKSQPDFSQLVRTTDIKSNFERNDFVYVVESAFKFLWRVNLNEESIILPNIGNCGEVYYVLPENLPYRHNVLGPNAILVRSRKVNNKFLSYLFSTYEFQTQLMKITSPTGQTKFNKTDLKRLVLPIPSREVQEEIVSILDRFDTLVNDLKSGLPAEIALRRKQYEYYRDKLLTFKPPL